MSKWCLLPSDFTKPNFLPGYRMFVKALLTSIFPIKNDETIKTRGNIWGSLYKGVNKYGSVDRPSLVTYSNSFGVSRNMRQQIPMYLETAIFPQIRHDYEFSTGF